MIELVTESLALQLDVAVDHPKGLPFPLESYAIGHENVPTGRGGLRRKCMDS